MAPFCMNDPAIGYPCRILLLAASSSHLQPRDEDDELSELQLRLLALQSASKKWQQKEQQVMKESKEKIIKAKPAQERGKAAAKAHQGKKNISPGETTAVLVSLLE